MKVFLTTCTKCKQLFKRWMLTVTDDWVEQRLCSISGIGETCQLLIKQFSFSRHYVPFFEAFPEECF